MEFNNKSDSVIIELNLDLTNLIFTNNGDVKQPICGTPETPIGHECHGFNHNSFLCKQAFKMIDSNY